MKMLVDVHRYHLLEQLLADVLAINHATTRQQAARYVRQALLTVEGIDNAEDA